MSAIEADDVLEALASATSENQLSSLRREQVVQLPPEGEVWMTGDLHDHRANFSRLVNAADLANNPQRHLILHELIHGEYFDANGAEDSWRTLVRAAVLKCDFPNQVHFLLANHDLAQIHGEGIMKMGLSVCEAFTRGLKRDFGGQYQTVNVAITEFLLSFPLAARTQTGLFFCHSMPADPQMSKFDFTVFDRPLLGEDYKRRVGPVYQLIWGRHMTPAAVEFFADKVGARIIITGHQPQEAGFAVNGPRHLILASDHNQGVFLPIDLAETYEMDGLVGRIRKFVSLGIGGAVAAEEDEEDSTEPSPRSSPKLPGDEEE
ncbi:MAG TPA: metallophosphoesterase [Tepidisphaeraceae bacterium]|nr:metallophosphoesterase [Tepidisphaeraceae bacterium]